MSANLRVRRVVLRAAHRNYEWRFQSGVTVVAGPGSVGKTSLLNLIKWGLGGDSTLSPAVRAVGRQVALDIEIGNEHVGLLRNVDRGRNRVEVLDASGDVRAVLSVDPADERRTTVSDFLLEALDIPRLQVPRSEHAPTAELTRITFNDVFAYSYLDQDEIARSTVHHLEGYRDVKRRQTFELLYRIIDTEVARIKRELSATNAERERLEAGIAAIRPFLERSGQLTKQELDLRAEQLSSQTAVAERELELLRGQARMSAEPSADARRELESLEAQAEPLRERLRAARREADRYRAVRAQLVQDLSRAVKAIVATPLFAGFEFELCPRCLQDLKTNHPSDRCRLCGQAEKQNVDSTALTLERERIEAQMRETDELLGDAETAHRELEATHEELRAKIAATRDILDRQTRQAVAPFVDRMATLSAQLGEFGADMRGLEASRRYLAEMQRLQDRREQLRREALELESRLAEVEDEQGLASQRVSDLSEIFAEILTDLELPWLRDAYIDRNSYLPIVNGERLEGLSSGSMKALVNTSYFLAGLTYAIRGYPTLLPRFMMIDSPRVHHGANPTDRRAGERIYRWLMRLQQALNDKAPFLGERTFQLIVADNDMPRFVRGLHVRRLSREEPLLSDVPGLDDEQLLRQLDEQQINNISAMSEQPVLLRFGRGQAATDAVQAVIDEALTALADDEQARAAGVHPGDVAGMAISVSEDRQGADPTVVAIVVAVAGGLTKDAALRLWDNVLWPRIKRRLGAAAVGPRHDE